MSSYRIDPNVVTSEVAHRLGVTELSDAESTAAGAVLHPLGEVVTFESLADVIRAANRRIDEVVGQVRGTSLPSGLDLASFIETVRIQWALYGSLTDHLDDDDRISGALASFLRRIHQLLEALEGPTGPREPTAVRIHRPLGPELAKLRQLLASGPSRPLESGGVEARSAGIVNHLRDYPLKNTFYAVRHGFSVSNERGILISDVEKGRSKEYGLTAQGLRDAQSGLEEWVAAHPELYVEARKGNIVIVSSDFSRARQTAEILAKTLGISVQSIIIKEELRERNFGTELEGQGAQICQQILERDTANPHHTDFGVESAAHLMERVSGGVVGIDQSVGEGKIVFLVSHDDTLHMADTAFRGMDPRLRGRIRHFHNAEVRQLNELPERLSKDDGATPSPIPPDTGPQTLGPALWQQVFRDGPEGDNLSPRFRRALIELVAKHVDRLMGEINSLDFSPSLTQLGKLIPIGGLEGDEAQQIKDLLQQVRQGGDNFLARLFDGIVALSLIVKHAHQMRPGQALDLSSHYLPLWFSLNLARDVTKESRDPDVRALRARFDQTLKNLRYTYSIVNHRLPPAKAFNWRKMRKQVEQLGRSKVGYGFLSVRNHLYDQMEQIPDAFPRFRAEPVQETATVPESDSLPPLSPGEELAIRDEIRQMARDWKADEFRIVEAINGVLTLARILKRDRPDESLVQTYHLTLWYLWGVLGILLPCIVHGRVKSAVTDDHTLNLYNRQLTLQSRKLMRILRLDPRIDDESVASIAEAFVCSRLQGRPLMVTSTHESGLDMPVITALLSDKGIRFVYKDILKYAFPINLILFGTNMPPVSRPKKTGDPDIDGAAIVRAIVQTQGSLKDRLRDGAMNASFGAGTRSLVGGVGPLKKGDANRAIDGDNPILVVTFFGLYQTYPKSLVEVFATRGIGMNRQIHVRVGLLDPRDFKPAGGLSPYKDRQEHVAALNSAILHMQIRNHLNIVETVYRAATPIGQEDGANTERIQINEFLDPYREAFLLLDADETKKAQKWCEKNKVAYEYVQALRGWIPREELVALYGRTMGTNEALALRLDHWQYLKRAASPVTLPWDHSTHPGNWARQILNRLVDAFRHPFFYLDQGDEDSLKRWCEIHSIDPAYVRALRNWIPDDELFCLYAWEVFKGDKPDAESATLLSQEIDDGITIEEVPLGSGGTKVVYTSKKHRPDETGEFSHSIYPNIFLGFMRRHAPKAMRAMRLGFEKGFDIMAAHWGAHMVAEAGMKVEVTGLEKLDPNKVYIFAPTHNSLLEVPLLFLVLRQWSQGHVPKEELTHWPVIGEFLREFRRFFVLDRKDKKKAMGLMDYVGVQLARVGNRLSVVIYPQGSRGYERRDAKGDRLDPDLFAKGPLRNGVGIAALRTVIEGNPVEVVPITINGAGRVKPRGFGPGLTNQTITVKIGDPIDPSRFRLDSEKTSKAPSFIDTGDDQRRVSRTVASRRILAEVEAAYRRDYEADLTPALLVKDPEVKRDPHNPTQDDLGRVDLGFLQGLNEMATPPDRALGESKWSDKAREILNRWLDLFYEAFMYLDNQDHWGLRDWCEENGVEPDKIRGLWAWIPEDELIAVYERHGAEGLTIVKMRDQRVGLSLLSNAGGRAVKRYVTERKPAQTGLPKIRYQDHPKEAQTFGELRKAYQDSRAGDLERTGRLLRSQLRIQSGHFSSFRWSNFERNIQGATAGFERGLDGYVTEYEQSESPTYQPVSDAILELHRAIIASDLFRDIDPGLRLFAFYTLQARDRYQEILAKDPKKITVEEKKLVRGRYYRLLGRGIRYRILNQIKKVRKDEGRSEKLRKNDVTQLRDRGERVELVAELLAQGIAMAERIKKVETDLDELGRLSQLRRWNYDSVEHYKLSEEHRHLKALVEEYGEGADGLAVLNNLAGQEFSFLQSAETVSFYDLLETHQSVKAAFSDVQRREAQWVEAYRAHLSKWAKRELDLYTEAFKGELKLHSVDHEIQVARYEDLMHKARQGMKVTYSMNQRYHRSVRNYEGKWAKYQETAQKMASPDNRSVYEPTRKRKELELFLAWLDLHWTVYDIYKEIRHPNTGRIRPFSAMFPNQVKFLNHLGSNEMRGLKPFIESFTREVLQALSDEIDHGGRDPREIGRQAAQVGFGSMFRGVDSILFQGAGTLAGALGQSQGLDLAEAGSSILAEDQVTEFGVVPQTAIFSANHMGIDDIEVAAAFFGLGLGRSVQAYEASNFERYPYMGRAFIHGDGIGFPRKRKGLSGGSTSLQSVLSRAIDRGVSPFVFEHGTIRVATTPIPLWRDAGGAFAPRPYVMGGNVGEGGEAARRNGSMVVPVWQDLPHNMSPDVKQSEDELRKNFLMPYAVSAGAPLGGQATVSIGEPIPGAALHFTKTDLERMGLRVERDRDVPYLSRRVMAAHTEMGRLWAMLKTLRGETDESPGDGGTGGRSERNQEQAPISRGSNRGMVDSGHSLTSLRVTQEDSAGRMDQVFSSELDRLIERLGLSFEIKAAIRRGETIAGLAAKGRAEVSDRYLAGIDGSILDQIDEAYFVIYVLLERSHVSSRIIKGYVRLLGERVSELGGGLSRASLRGSRVGLRRGRQALLGSRAGLRSGRVLRATRTMARLGI